MLLTGEVSVFSLYAELSSKAVAGRSDVQRPWPDPFLSVMDRVAFTEVRQYRRNQ